MESRRPGDSVKGFTLIEILVAMVILTAAIGICSRQYWSYGQALRRAQRELVAARVLVGLPEILRRELEQGKTSGAGALARQRGRYRWRAVLRQRERNHTQARGENGRLLAGNFLLTLYAVEVEISAVGDKRWRSYKYDELVWTKYTEARRGIGRPGAFPNVRP